MSPFNTHRTVCMFNWARLSTCQLICGCLMKHSFMKVDNMSSILVVLKVFKLDFDTMSEKLNVLYYE